MKASGPKHERETIIRYDDEGRECSIWTASDAVDRKLRKLGLEVIEEGERHTVFSCPKRQVRIARQRIISKEQHEVLSARMALTRSKQSIARPE